MRDGRILWTRSEYLDKGADFGHTLWAIRPDGTHPELIFGNNTRHCYVNAREVPGTEELCATLISHGGDLNGPIGLIAPQQGRFNPEAVTNITPDSRPHYNMNWARQQCFRDPVPIARDYFLVSHAPRKHFGLYVIDRWGNRGCCASIRPSAACARRRCSPRRCRSSPPPSPATDEGEFSSRMSMRDSVRRCRRHRHCASARSARRFGQLRRRISKDHPPFSFYASPTDLVRGPNGWPTYVVKAALGLAPGGRRLGALSCAVGQVLYFQLLDENLNGCSA
jgi:hypothetical protein